LSTDRYQNITDQELLEKFYSDRNNQWLGILLQRYTLLLLGVSMKYLRNEEEAKDSVQHVFLKAITELPKYRVEYFKSWIYMVARNHCLMKIRDRQGKIPAELTEKLMATPAEESDKKTHVEKDALLTRMTAALEELNEEQKRCVTLFYLNKRSYQDIADTTGYSLMQVKSHIQNGKRNLKLILEKNK
jgi:RNA polymerase sigma factor (sigma-70 family)